MATKRPEVSAFQESFTSFQHGHLIAPNALYILGRSNPTVPAKASPAALNGTRNGRRRLSHACNASFTVSISKSWHLHRRLYLLVLHLHGSPEYLPSKFDFDQTTFVRIQEHPRKDTKRPTDRATSPSRHSTPHYPCPWVLIPRILHCFAKVAISGLALEFVPDRFHFVLTQSSQVLPLLCVVISLVCRAACFFTSS